MHNSSPPPLNFPKAIGTLSAVFALNAGASSVLGAYTLERLTHQNSYHPLQVGCTSVMAGLLLSLPVIFLSGCILKTCDAERPASKMQAFMRVWSINSINTLLSSPLAFTLLELSKESFNQSLKTPSIEDVAASTTSGLLVINFALATTVGISILGFKCFKRITDGWSFRAQNRDNGHLITNTV